MVSKNRWSFDEKKIVSSSNIAISGRRVRMAHIMRSLNGRAKKVCSTECIRCYIERRKVEVYIAMKLFISHSYNSHTILFDKVFMGWYFNFFMIELKKTKNACNLGKSLFT